jgi:hypothetical protein
MLSWIGSASGRLGSIIDTTSSNVSMNYKKNDTLTKIGYKIN